MNAVGLLLLLLMYLTLVDGKNCIAKNSKCNKDEYQCGDGQICMSVTPGNSSARCGNPEEQERGCLCDPSLTSPEACAGTLTCKEINDNIFKCQDDDTSRDQCHGTGSAWELTYHHDLNGGAIFGSGDDLIAKVQTGCEVKVSSPKFGLVNIQKVSIGYDSDLGMECVNGQVLFWVEIQASRSGGINIYHVLQVHGTSGNHHASQFDVHDSVNYNRINSNSPLEMKWYTRCSAKIVSKQSTLKQLIRDGSSARVYNSVNDTIRPLEVADLRNGIEGVSMHELRDIEHGQMFNTTEQQVLKHWTLNDVNLASWLFNNHVLTLEKEEDVDIKWLVDPCWSLVYKHSENGKPQYGTKEDLTDAFQGGKRIRLQIAQLYYEATVIRLLDNGHVVAQVYDSVNSNVGLGQWEWLNVNTDGTVQTIKFPVGGSELISDDAEKMQVAWYAETRDWEEVVGEDAISDKVSKGADIRYKVEMSNQVTWYGADYALKSQFINPRVSLNKYILYHEREIWYNGADYIQRFSFGNWKTNAFEYYDFVVGLPEQVHVADAPKGQITAYYASSVAE